MEKIKYDYSKLLCRIKEKGFTQKSLSKAVGISETSLNFSLGNKRTFKQDEILSLCSILEIPIQSVDDYFFLPLIFRNLKKLITKGGCRWERKAKNRPALAQRGEIVIILMISIITAVMASLLTIALWNF